MRTFFIKFRHSAFAFAIPLIAAAAASPLAQAKDFPVNSTIDAPDANPGDGTCATAASVCTLRAAIQEANVLATNDTIILPKGIYVLTYAGKDEDNAASGDLDITGSYDLSIQGAGPNDTIIQGPSTTDFYKYPDRVFHFIGKNNVNITGVSIEKGWAQGSNLNGSGIYNAGAWVTLKDCQIKNNITYWAAHAKSGGMGGGIYNASGTRMTIDNCIITGNISKTETATTITDRDYNGGGAILNNGEMAILGSTIEANTTTRFGGGILNTGTLTITGSILRKNSGPLGSGSTTYGNQFGGGGAIANLGGRVTLRDSWVDDNMAMAGGGIHSSQGGSPTTPVMDIISSALTNNKAEQWGGGIENWGTMRVSYSTITGSAVSGGGCGSIPGVGGGCMSVPGDGAGIYNQGAANLRIENTTISGNITGGTGGGIYTGSGAKLSLAHTTLSNNKAGISWYSGVWSIALGSEIFLSVDSATPNSSAITLKHTIIAGTQASPSGNCLAITPETAAKILDRSQFQPQVLNIQPISFPVTSKGYNIDNGNTCVLAAATDKSNTNPLLATLSDPGQGAVLPGNVKVPQWLHMPGAGSPAIDAIPNSACIKPGVDQQLYLRPETAGGLCDIGAVEVNSSKASLADLQVAVSSASSSIGGASLNAKAVTGAEIRYEITLKNNGPHDVAGPVTVTQAFDGDVVFVRHSPPEVSCRQLSSTTIACDKKDKMGKDDKPAEIFLIVKPVISDKKALNTTVSVSSTDVSVVDHVLDNDSASLSRGLSNLDPVINNVNAGQVNNGGAGSFGAIPLALLAAFGVWRRRKFA